MVNGGTLWMPDTSIGVCFEKLLGLTGSKWKPKRLVQTSPIRSLADSVFWKRDTLDLDLPITRLWREGKKLGAWIKDYLWEKDGISTKGSEPLIERELRRVLCSGTMVGDNKRLLWTSPRHR